MDVDLRRVPDLDSLQLLVRVAELGSLSRAGRAHGISQPAASARVLGLERRVGTALVQRSARGSTLTPAGALVVGWARDVLAAAAGLGAGIASLNADRASRLRVAASMTVAEHLLPGWLVRLAAASPGTAVSLQAMNSTEVAAAVLTGDADIGFVEGPDVPAEMETRSIGSDRLVVVVSRGHPWTRRRHGIDAAELAGTRLVAREATSGTRAVAEAALRANLRAERSDGAPGEVVLARPVLELSTTTAVRTAVMEGAGPAVLSHLAVEQDVATGRLVVVQVEGVDLRRTLRAVWPSGQRPRGPAQDLLAIVDTTPRRARAR
ncbi:LysR family transcriptional regulator [uncultured Cellulomonas sp.]|uniref:LysR family transcriptional regulator n=1 Tax=uncultured Cellulomonas sp. TaxID=189682 RepID=UPI00263721B7|nr:LysR family transcriptional regulator [uncultured Cellulomonas sp.]